jgi:hypothetical protein
MILSLAFWARFCSGIDENSKELPTGKVGIQKSSGTLQNTLAREAFIEHSSI